MAHNSVSQQGPLGLLSSVFPPRRPTARERRAIRAKIDAALCERMQRVGLDPYVSAAIQTYVDLASEGVLVEQRGPQLRNHAIFRTVAARQGRANITAMRAHLAEIGIAPGEVLRFVLRGHDGWVELHHLRTALRHLGTQIQRAGDWARQRYGVDVVMRKLEAEPRSGGAYADAHGHVWAIPLAGADVDGFCAYMAGKFAYFGEAEPEQVDGGGEIDDYCGAKGPLKDNGTLDDDHLAEYVRQTARLHLWSFLGGLKAYRCALDDADEQVVEQGDEGQKVYLRIPRVHRPQRREGGRRHRTGQDDLLAIRLAWIGDELRLVAIVNNFTSWDVLAAKYDLDHAVALARYGHINLENAASHKSG
jgi:hypothetical protein